MNYFLSSRSEEKGTVLVFLPGEPEIIQVKRYLEQEENQKQFGSVKERRNWNILTLHSRMPFEDTK